ncbi:ArsR family transcriptional regulator [Caulobacter vibrioides]|uniref:ArsR/SmtB family transcription factor n=1 Tax=Caulobacter vibrioides TaxID=155892 RepID=UPI000BB49838|nr:winged helix-turn-helix domain-containing protein [Caulobacter vibrioides]ATC25958.1 ArsR family transcriptional regulator [Caulobacter vibrioides]AZH14098.1 ArsR family transcriptional regulator [Caulobacter vibrioides]PLR16401.1 ArsR family transcriptional regulator [Caulobacter vibrioides]
MDANIASPAALIGDPTRAAMLQVLQDGRAQPASALAWAAGVTAQAASNHLAKLVDGGLLAVERQGRHRYYRLASAEVAHAIEALSVIAAPVRSLEVPRSPKARALRDARCCYGHLAGRLGVKVCDALLDRDLIRPAGDKRYAITPEGHAWFEDLGVSSQTLRGARGVARPCLDWTERRHHLAGPLGVKLLAAMTQRGWLALEPNGRAVRLTTNGARALLERLGVSLEDADQAAA